MKTKTKMPNSRTCHLTKVLAYNTALESVTNSGQIINSLRQHIWNSLVVGKTKIKTKKYCKTKTRLKLKNKSKRKSHCFKHFVGLDYNVISNMLPYMIGDCYTVCWICRHIWSPLRCWISPAAQIVVVNTERLYSGVWVMVHYAVNCFAKWCT